MRKKIKQIIYTLCLHCIILKFCYTIIIKNSHKEQVYIACQVYSYQNILNSTPQIKSCTHVQPQDTSTDCPYPAQVGETSQRKRRVGLVYPSIKVMSRMTDNGSCNSLNDIV